MKCVTALIFSNHDEMTALFPKLAKAMDLDANLTEDILTLTMPTATVDENVDAVQDISRRLGVDPSVAAGFVVGNCNASLDEMAEVLRPLCQGLGAESKLCAAIVNGMNSAFVEEFEVGSNNEEFDYKIFCVLSQFLNYDQERITIVETMGGIAVSNEDVLDAGSAALTRALGFISNKELEEYRSAIKRQKQQKGKQGKKKTWAQARAQGQGKGKGKGKDNNKGQPQAGQQQPVSLKEAADKTREDRRLVQAVEGRITLLRCTVGVGKQDKLVLEELFKSMDVKPGTPAKYLSAINMFSGSKPTIEQDILLLGPDFEKSGVPPGTLEIIFGAKAGYLELVAKGFIMAHQRESKGKHQSRSISTGNGNSNGGVTALDRESDVVSRIPLLLVALIKKDMDVVTENMPVLQHILRLIGINDSKYSEVFTQTLIISLFGDADLLAVAKNAVGAVRCG